MFLKRKKEKRENRFGKKTQIVLLSLIFISVSISLAGITAYVTSGNTVSFQSAPAGPDLAVTSLNIYPQYPDINEYSTVSFSIANLGKNITSYYSVSMNFGDGTPASSFDCSTGCFWKSGEYRTFRVTHAYSNSGSFNVSANTYVSGDTTSSNNQRNILVPVNVPTILTINSTPSDANIYFDNAFVGVSPVVLQTTSGTHLLRAQKEGYVSNGTSTPYEISPGTSFVNIYLTPQTGNIFVDSSPQGASVYLDGSNYGTTPRTIYSVSLGTHSINVNKTGYYSYTTSVNVVSNQTTSVFAVLTPVTTTTILPVYSCSDSDGNNSYVKGTVTQTSNINGTVTTVTDSCLDSSRVREYLCASNGNINNILIYCSSGYSCYDGACAINLTTTTTTTLSTNGSIYATSSPTGANVYIDNVFKGTTPILVSPVQNGYRYVRFTKTGYYDAITYVTINASQTANVFRSLAQNLTTTTTTVAPICNYNGRCDLLSTGETCGSCPTDCCTGRCGDSVCDIYGLLGTPENTVTCSLDCKPGYCGDHICDIYGILGTLETKTSCSADCK